MAWQAYSHCTALAGGLNPVPDWQREMKECMRPSKMPTEDVLKSLTIPLSQAPMP